MSCEFKSPHSFAIQCPLCFPNSETIGYIGDFVFFKYLEDEREKYCLTSGNGHRDDVVFSTHLKPTPNPDPDFTVNDFHGIKDWTIIALSAEEYIKFDCVMIYELMQSCLATGYKFRNSGNFSVWLWNKLGTMIQQAERN